MKKFLLSLAVTAIVSLSISVQASSGYWSHGNGPESKSMAGACVAMTLGAMCGASNPASLALVGNRFEIGVALFAPERGFTADDNLGPFSPIPPGEYKSRNDLFLIPHFAFNKILDEASSIGVTLGANAGNTEYDSAVFVNFNRDPSTGAPGPTEYEASSPTGIDLKQMLLGISYSQMLNEEHSIGITPIIAFQTFSASGLEPFKAFSLHENHVTNNGDDFSYGGGLRLGWLWQMDGHLKIGASYQTKLWMTDFDEYKGLIAEEGNFDIPPNMDLGFSVAFTSDWIFAFNYQRIWFSQVNAIGNQSDLVFIPGTTILGTDDGLGFGWDDINVYKFGLQWEYDTNLTLRAGYSYGTDIFEGSQALFNILAPSIVKHHYTAGIGWNLDKENKINFSFMYAPEEKIEGTNPNTGLQTGDVWMSQWEMEIGWTTLF